MTGLSDSDLPAVDEVSPLCAAFDSRDHRMRISLDEGWIRAEWPAAIENRGTTVYLLCASATAVPEEPNGGKRILLTLFNSASLVADDVRYLAVFAYEVTEISTLNSAVGIRHALGRVPPEVVELEVTAEEHGVLISWSRPSGVDRVRVMRSVPNGPLPVSHDHSMLLPFVGDTFRDSNVKPGATYTYRVYTESLPLGVKDGSREYSPGQERVVKVPGTPERVTDLTARIELRNGKAGVSVSWLRPRTGSVRVFLTAGSLSDEIVTDVAQSAEQFAMQQGLLGRRLRDPILSDDNRNSIDWVPLDSKAGDGRYSRWTVTATTVLAGWTTIGAHQVVDYVGDIDELDIDERVDWQLVRSTWPTGATLLGYWVVDPGSSSIGGPQKMMTRDEFDEYGGIPLQLPPQPKDILVQGAIRNGAGFSTGRQSRIAYPGRWVVRYDLKPTGWFGARQLRIVVERSDWPDFEYRLIASTMQGFPLTINELEATFIAAGVLRSGTLSQGFLVPVGEKLKLPRNSRLRMFVSTSVQPIVVDPFDPPTRKPDPRSPIEVHCPRCLQGSDLWPQYYRCQGTCPREEDRELTELLDPGTVDQSHVISAKPIFSMKAPRGERNTSTGQTPTNSAICPKSECGQVSNEIVCPRCHFRLPADWWSHDLLGVVMVGARSVGKTTYLCALMRHLERNLVPRLHGHLEPVDMASAERLNEIREGMLSGILPGGTQGASQNQLLLTPILASIGTGQDGRNRTLALFDVAGEDMARPDSVRPYSPALTGADLIAVIIDPLQLDGIREWLDGKVPLPLKGVPAVTVVYNVVQEIRRRLGISAGALPQRIAVILAKFDGLQQAAKISQSGVGSAIGPGNAMWRDPYLLSGTLYDPADGLRVHEEVRALLTTMGESALVTAVESSFRDVRYFAVSSLGHGPSARQMTTAGASPQRVGDPLRWLFWLARWGV